MKRILSLIICGAMTLAGLASCCTAEKGAKSIKSVEKVTVESPEGTVPRLPSQLWVTYNDGTGAYRDTLPDRQGDRSLNSIHQRSGEPEELQDRGGDRRA